MSTFTWKGAAGNWGVSLNWVNLAVPSTVDDALISASTATLAAPATIHNVTLSGSGSLLLQDTLTVSGTLLLNGGTLDLANGTVLGGTLDDQGVVTGSGTFDGTRILHDLGFGMTVTAATIAASAAGTGTVAVAGTLVLAAGTYDNATMQLDSFTTGQPELLTTSGTVVFGTAHQLVFNQGDPPHDPGVPPATGSVGIAVQGSAINLGSIYSDATTTAPLTISGDSFQNVGQFFLSPILEPDVQQSYSVSSGKHTTLVPLTWTQTWTPGLAITAARFDNTGFIGGNGATITVSSATFSNEGGMAPIDATAQQPVVTKTAAYVGTVELPSQITFDAGVTSFSNTGTLSAGTIDFRNNLTLGELGTLGGHIVFDGTLDLQNGTLDLGSFASSSFTFAGKVENGTIITQGATADFSAATLTNVTTLDVRPITLLDVASGAVALDGTTVELAYTTAATVDHLAVTGGVAGVEDKIGARAAGTLTFGADTSITDVVAGSTLAIGGLGSFRDDGQILLDGATLVVATTLDGAGTITLQHGAALAIASLATTATTDIVFGAGANLLSLPGDGTGLAALGITITGLQPGDLIDFMGVSANPSGPFAIGGADISNGTLDVQGASGDQAQIRLSAASAGLTFTVNSDPNGGTLVTVACFRTGTLIATDTGERAVEALRIGDRVRTASGALRPVRWLGRRSYGAATVADQRQLRPVCVSAGALGDGLPLRDLYLSPLHALLLDGVLVPAAALVNGASITRGPIAAVSYIHIELETPDIILAEGAATETFVDCDSRAMFDNAAEFLQLYPDAPDQRWAYPVERVEEGWQLDTIRARLAPGTGVLREGKLRGSIDCAENGQMEGWLMDEADPSNPVAFELLADGAQLDCRIANRYRIDLDRAGLGFGTCAFTATLPRSAVGQRLQLRRLSDGAVLGA